MKSHTPALLINTCNLSYFSSYILQQFLIDSNDDKSQYNSSIFLFLVDLISSSFVFFPFISSLVVNTIVAPNFAKPIAVSFPIPDVAPVIKIILSYIIIKIKGVANVLEQENKEMILEKIIEP